MVNNYVLSCLVTQLVVHLFRTQSATVLELKTVPHYAIVFVMLYALGAYIKVMYMYCTCIHTRNHIV